MKKASEAVLELAKELGAIRKRVGAMREGDFCRDLFRLAGMELEALSRELHKREVSELIRDSTPGSH
jgi:hypothetical protein